MASPEQEQGPFQQEGDQEKEPKPYHKAARFKGEQIAGKAYFQAQDLIFKNPECDPSAYRFQLNRIWHIAALGNTPPENLDQKLQEILATGEPVPLPPQILEILTERRSRAIKQGPWVERHFRPGQHL